MTADEIQPQENAEPTTIESHEAKPAPETVVVNQTDEPIQAFSDRKEQ